MLYDRFLPLIPAGGLILDAGCGAGRDAKVFVEAGYRVTAFDASPEIAVLASKYLGQEVLVREFGEIRWKWSFDGIWACASLLHVPYNALSETFRTLVQALKPDGVMYTSFKFGQGERIKHGRHFTDIDEPRLREILSHMSNHEIIDIWLTGDRRPEREKEKWLNALIRKKGVEAP
jgi:SAM-dependent methyltransferase